MLISGPLFVDNDLVAEFGVLPVGDVVLRSVKHRPNRAPQWLPAWQKIGGLEYEAVAAGGGTDPSGHRGHSPRGAGGGGPMALPGAEGGAVVAADEGADRLLAEQGEWLDEYWAASKETK